MVLSLNRTKGCLVQQFPAPYPSSVGFGVSGRACGPDGDLGMNLRAVEHKHGTAAAHSRWWVGQWCPRAGTPVRVFGVLRLPPIAPFNIDVFSFLREAHSILAYLLVVVAAHVSVVLGDGMLRLMTLHIDRRERSKS